MQRLNKVSFYLARPKGTVPSVILVRLKIDGREVRFGSGISIPPKHWNRKVQRVKGSVTGSAPMNDRLERIALDLKTIVLSLQSEGIELTPERVKSRFDALTLKDATRSGEKGFLDYLEDWKAESEGKVTRSTLTVYTTTQRHLKEFSEARGRTLTFDGMDRAFVNEFTRYLSTVAGLQDGTIEKYRKTWKTFMRWAVDRGLTSNTFFESVPKLKTAEALPNRLTFQELERLTNVDLSDAPPLSNARDLFVLQCWTGVRYGDLKRIVDDPASYRRGDTFELTSQKTGRSVRIPLLPEVLRILDGPNPPHSISNQRMNEFLKEAAKRAGLDRSVRQTEQRGKQRSETTSPLHDVLSTHDAKRTFVSLAAERGISREIIREITGNTDKTLNRYLNLDEKTVHDEFRRAFELQPH